MKNRISPLAKPHEENPKIEPNETNTFHGIKDKLMSAELPVWEAHKK